jgi:glycogen(starch) synthase
MNLVFLSHAFAPSVGGVETVTRILAERFHAEGNTVTVVTSTDDPAHSVRANYSIVRNPSNSKLLKILHDADAVVQSNITLTWAWPLYIARIFSALGVFSSLRRKPFVTVLHSPLTIPGHAVRTQERLKAFCLDHSTNYAVSDYLRGSYGPSCGFIPNPYGESIFRAYPDVQRSKPLLFVGRLTIAKGCEIAIEALSILHRSADARTDNLHLNIVGTGPDEAALRQQAADSGLKDYVHFLGPVQGEALARLMNEHTLLLVPSRSRPPESLPIVVLEGIACGCIVIVSAQGGLPEAIGSCGLAFPEGDPIALAEKITAALNSTQLRADLLSGAPQHLAEHRLDSVEQAYIAALEREGLHT